MKILIIWDFEDDELFGATLANDDEVQSAFEELNTLVNTEPDLGLVVFSYTPDTRDDLITSIKEHIS